MAVGILPTVVFGNGGGGGSGPTSASLASLTDVSLSSPVSSQLLSYGNDGFWHNTNLSSNPEFQVLQSQVLSISTSAFTPLTTTAALTANLQSQISSEVTNRQLADQNLQQQINELASSSHVVFCEIVTGNGISSQFQLTGLIANGEFISGGWQATNVLNTLHSDVTDMAGKPIYDGGIMSVFTRHRISVDTINITGLVTLDYIPLNNQVFKVWYWYDLQGTDRINNYYRDDFVAAMEETNGDLATNIQSNVVNFNNILSSSDNTVQRALETLDDHTHPEIASISASVINLSQDVASSLHIGLNIISTGVVSGGVLTAASSSSFNIGAGFGMIIDHSIVDSSFNPSASVHQWNDINNISVTPYITAGFPYIFVGLDDQVQPYITTHEFTPEERRDYMELGKVSLRGGSIAAVISKKGIPIDYGASIFDVADAIGSLNLTGNVFGPSGNNLSLVKSAGTSFRYSINVETNIKQPSNTIDPAMSPVTFFRAYRNAAGTDFVYVKGQTTVDPGMWDDGTGTLNTVSHGSYSVQRIYYFPGGNNTYVLYGQASYPNTTQARLSINTENFVIPDDVLNGSTFRGWLILRSNATNLSDPLEAIFIPATKFGTSGGGGSINITQNHNDLNGLQGGNGGEYYHLTAAQISGYVGLSTVQSLSAQVYSLDANNVHLTGNESISGSKNFATTPTVSGSYDILHTGNAFFEWHQTVADTLWTVNHNLNRHPSVTTTNDLGNVIIGTVSYINNNTVTIRFTPARTGYAYFT